MSKEDLKEISDNELMHILSVLGNEKFLTIKSALQLQVIFKKKMDFEETVKTPMYDMLKELWDASKK